MSLQPTPLEWILLRLIDAMPSWGNDYKLNRIFMGTEACLTFWESLRDLVEKKWLHVKDPKAQVKQYDITEEGRKLLVEGYSISLIKDYVMFIQPTGFIVELLEKMDANASESSGS